jgi:hypothetical protein
MKTHFLVGLLFLTLSQLAIAEPIEPDIKEGLWELTFKSEIAAMPTSMHSVAYTSQRCLSKQKAGDPHTLLQNNQCDISDWSLKDNVGVWKMRCQQAGNDMIGEGKVHYQRESFNALFTMNSQGKGAQALSITTQTSGRYLGDCH